MNRCLVALLILPALARPVFAQSKWTDVAPKDAGFTIQAPGTLRPTPQKPDHYEYTLGDSSFMVDVGPLEESVRAALARGDRAFLTTFLETLRDQSIASAKGTHHSSSKDDFRGRPSVLFSFGGSIGSRAFEAHQRIVLSPDRAFFVVAIGFTDELKQADVNRFLDSFRIVAAPPMPAAPSSPQPPPPPPATGPAPAKGMKTVSFTDAVCAYIPAIPITFEMPADLIARKIGDNSEAGCLWGVKEDLDRITADPSQGDFTDLRRGVFRARLSTNVVCDPKTGIFDSMDGAGEGSIRTQLQGAGARVVIWKKSTLGGLPALQIVADVAGSRVYMLYLGNTKYISNVMLVNYYPPNTRSAADDELWARFVEGIRKVGG